MKKLPPPGSERRRHVRKNVIESQLVTVELGPHQRGVLIDVSAGGIAVQPFVPIPVGTTSSVQFPIPGSDTCVSAIGMVAWVSDSGRTGIRFTDVPSPTALALRRWVSRDEATDMPTESLNTPSAIAAELGATIREQNLDIEAALSLICERACELVKADGAAIATAQKDVFVCRASHGMAPDIGVVVQPGVGLAGECVRSGRRVLCLDTQRDPRVDAAAAMRLNLRSTVVVPAINGDRVTGLIQGFATTPNAFDSDSVDLLSAFADLVAQLTHQLPPAPENNTPQPPQHTRESSPSAQAAMQSGSDVAGPIETYWHAERCYRSRKEEKPRSKLVEVLGSIFRLAIVLGILTGLAMLTWRNAGKAEHEGTQSAVPSAPAVTEQSAQATPAAKPEARRTKPLGRSERKQDAALQPASPLPPEKTEGGLH